MSVIIYDPKKQIVKCGDKELSYYCGQYLTDLDVTLVSLALGLIDARTARTDLLQWHYQCDVEESEVE